MQNVWKEKWDEGGEKNRRMGMDSEKADCWVGTETDIRNPNWEGRVKSGRRCPQCSPGAVSNTKIWGKGCCSLGNCNFL